MTAQTLTLTDFILQRIAEDEAVAKRVQEAASRYDGASWIVVGSDNWAGDYDPARVLAECEAKRRIVERHAGPHQCPSSPTRTYFVSDGCPTVHDLALPYADHPDYNPDWRP